MPMGGYLYGKAMVIPNGVSSIPNKTTFDFDSSTSPDSITVAEAKKRIINSTVNGAESASTNLQMYQNVLTRSVSPSPTTYGLAKGQVYYSEKFSSATLNSWRYGGYQFQEVYISGGTTYINEQLEWKTIGGPGRIGTYNTAMKQYTTNQVQGTKLNVSSTWTRIGGSAPLMYWTNSTNAQYNVRGW